MNRIMNIRRKKDKRLQNKTLQINKLTNTEFLNNSIEITII